MYRIKDVYEYARNIHVGDKIEFGTDFYEFDDFLKRYKVTGKVIGKYPHGVMVGFRHRKKWYERWLPYSEIFLASMDGKLPTNYRSPR